MQIKKLLAVVLLLICKFVFAQSDTLTIMYYNVLNYPGSTAERVNQFRIVNRYIGADIILTNEMISENGAIALLEQGLNVFGTIKYKKAIFTDGPDTDNMLYFNSDKIGLYSQDTIQTALRMINEYVLYYRSADIETTNDTIFFYMYSAHLKASSGTTNKLKRLKEVRRFRSRIDNLPLVENIFFGGDLNFYTSSEPAYDTLINYGVYPLYDALPAGSWHDNASFANIHSQSTRTAQFGGGATGGLDDRFDFILFSDDVVNGTNKVKYIDNTYHPVGNDGNHLNKSIIDSPVNTSVPDSVLQALYYMSDHLPVICKVEVEASAPPQDITLNLKVFLEGPFDNAEMNTGLNSTGNLPLSQPYNTLPWNYEGAETVALIPNSNIVDWVLIELRDASDAEAATSETMIAQQAAFLLNDGSVVGLDGSSILSFNHSIIHALFTTVWHRNHIGILSANFLSETDGVYIYDFSTGPDKVYETESGYKEIATGIWGMVAGDSDANGIIDESDKNTNWNIEAGKTGYFPSDFNLDTQVDNEDKNNFWWPNVGKGESLF